MNKSEVAKLFERIVQYYPSFTGDINKIHAWHEILISTSFDLAINNLKRHVTTEKFPPTIAELSKPLQPIKTDAERFHDHMNSSGIKTLKEFEHMQKLKAVPPTTEQRRRVRDAVAR